MSATGYTILAYVIGLTLLWGYALKLWLDARRTDADGEIGDRQ